MFRLLLMAFLRPGCTSRALDPDSLTRDRFVLTAPTYLGGMSRADVLAIPPETVADLGAAQ